MTEKLYRINEIFYSLQGEGSFVGTPMVFVRFAGCNRTCHFCDTDHQPNIPLTLDEVDNEITIALKKAEALIGQNFPICFTGGEPTLQLDNTFLRKFRVKYVLHMETNGSKLVQSPTLFECITVSPKSVKVPEGFMINMSYCSHTELKVVMDDRDEWKDIINSWGSYLMFKRHYIQPMARDDGSSNIDDVIAFIKKYPRWNLSMQTHKMINIQ